MATISSLHTQKAEGRHHGAFYNWTSQQYTSEGAVPTVTQTAMIAWSVVFPEHTVPHPTQTKVALRNITLMYHKISTNQWVTLCDGLTKYGVDHNDSNFAIQQAQSAVLSDDVWLIAPTVGYCTERYEERYAIPMSPSQDFDSVFASVEHKLVMTDGSDLDKFSLIDAQYVVQCGIDYWPLVSGGSTGNTNAGQGRICRAKPWWRRSFYYASTGGFDIDANPPVDVSTLL